MLVVMTDWQKQFENLAAKPDPIRLRDAVLAARANKTEGRESMLGAMTPPFLAQARPKRSMTSSHKLGSLPMSR